MFVFVFWSHSTGIFDQGFATFHNDTSGQGGCINPHSDFVSINTPITLCQLGNDVCQHPSRVVSAPHCPSQLSRFAGAVLWMWLQHGASHLLANVQSTSRTGKRCFDKWASSAAVGSHYCYSIAIYPTCPRHAIPLDSYLSIWIAEDVPFTIWPFEWFCLVWPGDSHLFAWLAVPHWAKKTQTGKPISSIFERAIMICQPGPVNRQGANLVWRTDLIKMEGGLWRTIYTFRNFWYTAVQINIRRSRQ